MTEVRKMIDVSDRKYIIHVSSLIANYSSILHAIYERECNEGSSPELTAEADELRGNASHVASIFGLYLYHQTDPRGPSIYVAPFPLNDSNYTEGRAV